MNSSVNLFDMDSFRLFVEKSRYQTRYLPYPDPEKSFLFHIVQYMADNTNNQDSGQEE